MRDNNAYSGAHLLISFLAGAAAGAVTALLMAPQSGSESRTMLRGWAREAQDKAVKVPGALKVAYERAAHEAKEAFTNALNETAREEVEIS